MRRSLVAVVLGLLAVVGSARGADAQDLECDRGDLEVRGLDFRGNRAFDDDELAVNVATTPSSIWRRAFRFFGTRRCLDSAEVRSDSVRLRLFYRRAGYWQTTVKPTIQPKGTNKVKVIFDIVEGPPILIREATIAGLDSVPNRGNVLRGLYTAVGKPFDWYRINADYDSIISRLRNQGYPRADVLRNNYEVKEDSLIARVFPVVIPGTRARFDGVEIQVATFEGESRQIPDKVVRQLLGIDAGDLYRDRDIVDAQRNLYQTGAFRHVDVSPFPDSLQPAGDTLVALRVNLVEDYMRQLDSEVGWATLDCFRTRLVYTNKNFLRGARRLELTGQVTKIGIGEPLATEGTKGLCYRPLQKDPFSARMNYFLGATYRQPAFFGRAAVPAVSIYSERRGEYLAYLRSTPIGGEVSVTKNLGRLTTPLRVGYSLEYGKTQAQPALLCAVFRRCDEESQNQLTDRLLPLAVASATIARVRTDNDLLPTRGTVVRTELRSSSPVIGSDRQLAFNKAIIDGSWYKGLWGSTVFAARFRAGTIFGGQTTNGGARLPPPQERLYAGGATSVRGFQQNELGSLVYLLEDKYETLQIGDEQYYYTVADTNAVERTVPVGGNSLLIGNFELRLRSPVLSDLIRYTLFADVGEVWTRGGGAGRFGFGQLKWTPGVGLRVFSPVGPIQVNVGYNAYRRPAGPAFYDLPIDPTGGGGQLYCIAAVDMGVTGAELEQQVRERGVPATQGTNGVWRQNPAVQCPAFFRPRQSSSFFSKLAFTFSIGPDF